MSESQSPCPEGQTQPAELHRSHPQFDPHEPIVVEVVDEVVLDVVDDVVEDEVDDDVVGGTPLVDTT
jgi:hypothetical protein